MLLFTHLDDHELLGLLNESTSALTFDELNELNYRFIVNDESID